MQAHPALPLRSHIAEIPTPNAWRKKHTSQPQSQQRLSWFTLFLLPLSRANTRPASIKRTGPTPAPGNRGSPPTRPAWPRCLWVFSWETGWRHIAAQQPDSPPLVLPLGWRRSPKQYVTRFPWWHQLNTFYSYPDFDQRALCVDYYTRTDWGNDTAWSRLPTPPSALGKSRWFR